MAPLRSATIAPTQGLGEVKPIPSRDSSSTRLRKSSSVWRDVVTTQALFHHERPFRCTQSRLRKCDAALCQQAGFPSVMPGTSPSHTQSTTRGRRACGWSESSRTVVYHGAPPARFLPLTPCPTEGRRTADGVEVTLPASDQELAHRLAPCANWFPAISPDYSLKECSRSRAAAWSSPI